MRFTIRDLIWLTALIAMGLGWFMHVRAVRSELLENLDRQVRALVSEKGVFKKHIAELEAALSAQRAPNSDAPKQPEPN